VQTVYQQLHAGPADVPVEMPQEAPADADDISAIFQVWENDFGRDKMLVLVKGLQKRLPADMDILQQSLDHKDTEKIRTVSHQLVGSLGSMQMMEGMRLARQAETIAAGDDKSTLGNAVSALIAYLETTLQQLQEIGKE
jgi:HPt (histidine-containing phosphotransfer) domain-containing protein